MAMKLGTENKRQVYLAVGLIIAIIVVAIYEYGGSAKTNTTASMAKTGTRTTQPKSATNALVPTVKGPANAAAQDAQSGPAAEKVASLNLDPALQLQRLSYTESIYYEGRGRNIFSMDSVPMAPIEETLASARPNAAAEVKKSAFDYEIPEAPPIDLKYFGYTVGKDKVYKAFFVKGDDIFIARTGEIVNRVYKIGNITATGVEVTDLGHNNTRTVPITSPPSAHPGIN
jgi:hypothetical protein